MIAAIYAHTITDRLARLLFVTLEAARVRHRPCPCSVLSVRGSTLGAVSAPSSVAARQDYHLQLTHYADRGWRATF
jgi:hypothetical protein